MCCISGTFLLHVLVLKLLCFSNIVMRHSSSAICLTRTIRSLSVLVIATASSDSSNICAVLAFVIFPHSAALVYYLPLFSCTYFCFMFQEWSLIDTWAFCTLRCYKAGTFLKDKNWFILLFVMYMCACVGGGPTGVSDPLELELWVFVSCPMWCWELSSGSQKKLQVFFTTEQHRWPWEWRPLKVAF